MSWTPSHLARDLDSSLRRPGWGLIFTGLPGGIQLQAPNPHAGRLVLCSSACKCSRFLCVFFRRRSSKQRLHSGIDLEPDGPTQPLVNITIRHCNFNDNDGNG